jgi:predicted DsbA family dithiol-disulfide isomerase
VTLHFGLTWDYRCPFARNAHEHVITGLRGGADWEVEFIPFSLSQAHVEEGGTDVWDDPSSDSGLLALQAGVAVRDHDPERFLDAHEAIFALRHDHGLHLRDEATVAEALAGVGVDADAVMAEVRSGSVLDTVRKAHEAAVHDLEVWGVPTFTSDDHAVFVRLMNRPRGDVELARTTIERTMGLLLGWPELNEFKHTSLKR